MKRDKKKQLKTLEWDQKLDAVVAAPDSHLILLENDKVRVLEVVIKPLHKEPMHTHKWPSVMITDSSANIRYHDDKGNATEYPKRDISSNNPLVEYLEPEGLHAVENIDDIPYHAYRIETKQ
mgnify:CR=1 FL=1